MSATATVRSDQRYDRHRPCPICRGHADMPQGKNSRCWGFTSSDGEYAHCTREQYAGRLEPRPDGTFAHRLRGPCKCGVTHGPEPPARMAARSQPPVTMRYEVRDESGQLVGEHVRQDFLDTAGHPYRNKTLRWERHNGRGSTLMPLYRLVDHVVAPRSALRIICEGEKAADALHAALVRGGNIGDIGDLIALGTVTGASATPCDDSLRPLVGYRVALWPDRDDIGRKHMERIAAQLVALGASAPQWVDWPDAPPKGDAADYFQAGRTVEELPRFIHAASSEVAPDGPDGRQRKIGTLLADVNPEAVCWLWPGRIPLGKLVVLDGDPGLGKSLVTLDLAARLSAGREMPDGSRSSLPASGVVLLSAEDGLADTIRPRLDAAGADTARIVALDTVMRPGGEGDEGAEPVFSLPTLPRDLPALRSAIARVAARLVIIDPLMAFLGSEVDAHRDQDVRTALAQLAALAEDTGAAVLVVRHLNKLSGGNPLYRGGGSIGIIGAARSGLLIATDPDDEQRRVLASTKNNLAVKPPALAYSIEINEHGVPHVTWLGESRYTAVDLVGPALDSEIRSQTSEAIDWLRDYLALGVQPAAQVIEAARAAHIGEKPLRRAREKICLSPPRREGFGPGSKLLWELRPEEATKSDEDHRCPDTSIDAQQNVLGTYDVGGHLWSQETALDDAPAGNNGPMPIDALQVSLVSPRPRRIASIAQPP